MFGWELINMHISICNIHLNDYLFTFYIVFCLFGLILSIFLSSTLSVLELTKQLRVISNLQFQISRAVITNIYPCEALWEETSFSQQITRKFRILFTKGSFIKRGNTCFMLRGRVWILWWSCYLWKQTSHSLCYRQMNTTLRMLIPNSSLPRRLSLAPG